MSKSYDFFPLNIRTTGYPVVESLSCGTAILASLSSLTWRRPCWFLFTMWVFFWKWIPNHLYNTRSMFITEKQFRETRKISFALIDEFNIETDKRGFLKLWGKERKQKEERKLAFALQFVLICFVFQLRGLFVSFSRESFLGVATGASCTYLYCYVFVSVWKVNRVYLKSSNNINDDTLTIWGAACFH